MGHVAHDPSSPLYIRIHLVGRMQSVRSRRARARDAEIAILSHLTFKQAAEPGRCIDENCVSQEAGFAYAKQKAVLQADDCIGKGDEDFVEGCRQYAEDVDEAYRDAVEK